MEPPRARKAVPLKWASSHANQEALLVNGSLRHFQEQLELKMKESFAILLRGRFDFKGRNFYFHGDINLDFRKQCQAVGGKNVLSSEKADVIVIDKEDVFQITHLFLMWREAFIQKSLEGGA